MSDARDYDETMTDAPQDEMPDPADLDEVEPTGSDADYGDGGNTLESELEAALAEKQAAFEKLARVQADYQNAQRRLEKEMDQRLRIAAGQLIKAFLPVLDNLERALDVPDSADVKSVIAGVRGTYDQWVDVLQRNGVEPVAPEPGTPFDPNDMEALMQEPADYDVPSVTRLLQRGYKFDGRIIRPAQVAVSRNE